jgi:hypothetical protein
MNGRRMPRATAELVSKLAGVFARYLANERRREAAAAQERTPLPHTGDAPIAESSPMRGVTSIRKAQADPARGQTGAVRIPPDEFHGMPDRTTDN